jgi:hypothetical protein
MIRSGLRSSLRISRSNIRGFSAVTSFSQAEGQGLGNERNSGLGNTGMGEQFRSGMRVEYKTSLTTHRPGSP